MSYETYSDLQYDYFMLFQSNANFNEITTEKQFNFINKVTAKRYKIDYKLLVRYEKQKKRRIKAIYKRNKRKFGVVSNSLAIEMYENEQKLVSKLNKEYEKYKFEKKRERLLNRLKIGSKTNNRRTVQGTSSPLNEDGAKKEVSCNLHEADVIEQCADEE